LTSIPTIPAAVTTTTTSIGLGGFYGPPSTLSTTSAPSTSTTSVYTTSTLGPTSIIQKPKESSDPMDQLLPPQLNDLVDNFITMLSETEQFLTDMEHTSTSKFVNVHEQIVRVQQHVLDIQGDVQRDEATFAQINQAYQQELYNATICKYLRSLPLGADIDDRVVDNYLMQKVEDIKINYKQCQDVLNCAE